MADVRRHVCEDQRPDSGVWREKCAVFKFHANTIPVTAREGRELEELEGRQVA
jgi:hypothetical protein